MSYNKYHLEDFKAFAPGTIIEVVEDIFPILEDIPSSKLWGAFIKVLPVHGHERWFSLSTGKELHHSEFLGKRVRLVRVPGISDGGVVITEVKDGGVVITEVKNEIQK